MNNASNAPVETSRTAEAAARRERIRTAYDPELVRAAGQNLSQQMAEHLHAVYASQGNVLNWHAPEDSVLRATEIARSWSTLPSSVPFDEITARFAAIVSETLDRAHNLHDPRYMGHQVPAPIPLAGLFDAIGAITNQVMAVYEMGPWATAVEQAMVRELMSYLGWSPQSSAGFVTHGATLANLNALLVARNICLGNSWTQGLAPEMTVSGSLPVLVVNADAHYSISRAAGILGIGTRQVVKVGLDDRRRMDPRELDATLTKLRSAGHAIIAVVACACSTPIGAFDDLNGIADLCERHGVWLHVDAAHGGSLLLSDKHRDVVAGLNRADSLVWDAHKMLFVPALCAFLYFKRKEHSFEAFRQDAPYLFDPSAPGLAEFDLGLRTMECTKRAATFGLWGTWSLFGPRLFADLVDETMELGQRFYAMLGAEPDFEVVYRPQCNIAVFRYLPEELRTADRVVQDAFQRRLRREVIESGTAYLVAANLDGKDVLRVTLINPLSTDDHLRGLLATLRTTGTALLRALPQ